MLHFPSHSRSKIATRLMVLALLPLVACKDIAAPGGNMGRIRVVSSVFQGSDAASSVPVAIDVLIDSSMSGPGLSGLAAASLSPGAASGEGAGAHGNDASLFSAAGYRDVGIGIHSFVARVSGTTDTTSNLFRTDGGAFLPKQYLVAFPYTFIIAGVVPPNGTAPGSGAVPYMLIPDDPFTPPDSAGALTARVQLINAAPMADPSGQGADITATFDDGTGGVFTAIASYRGTSGYINPPAGNYTLTLATANGTLYSGAVAFAKGEVRSFIVQSTAYADVPGPANTKVTNLLDNQW